MPIACAALLTLHRAVLTLSGGWKLRLVPAVVVDGEVADLGRVAEEMEVAEVLGRSMAVEEAVKAEAVALVAAMVMVVAGMANLAVTRQGQQETVRAAR